MLDDCAIRAALLAKLAEEPRVVRAAGEREERVKELADVLEVFEALLSAEEVEWDEVRTVWRARRDARGGFERRLWLRWTENGP